MHLNSLNQTLSARNEILPQTLRSQDFEKDSPPLKTHRGYKTVQNNS
jgi:hypothetical protein